MFDRVARFLKISTDWRLVCVSSPVADIYGESRQGEIMKRHVKGVAEYRLPTDIELEAAAVEQAFSM